MRGEPNTAIRHLSKCGPEQMQENITFYDENGNMCLQIHFGHHGYPKNITWGRMIRLIIGISIDTLL